MPQDSPDFLRWPAPGKLGDVVVTAGQAISNDVLSTSFPAAQSLAIVSNFGGILGTGQLVSRVKVMTFQNDVVLDWIPPVPVSSFPPLYVPWNVTMMSWPTVQITLTGNAAATETVATIWELGVPAVPFVTNSPQQPLLVSAHISDALVPVSVNGATVTLAVQGPAVAGPAVGVNIQPEVPGVLQKGFSGVLGVGSTAVVVPAVAGKRIALYHLTWGMSSGLAPAQVNGQMQDTQLNTVDQVRADVFTAAGMCASPVHPTNFRGATLPLGAGLQLKNVGNVTFDYNGAVVYTQS